MKTMVLSRPGHFASLENQVNLTFRNGPTRKTPLAVGASVFLFMALPSLRANSPASILLRDSWLLQSAARIQDGGDRISKTAFHPEGWYRTSVPTTVFAALVDSKVYADPYVGMNLLSIPGTGYARHTGANDIEHNFSNAPMSPDSPFKSAWWFRTEFHVPDEYRNRTVWLHFDGINYRANIWLNGKRIATAENVAGAWRVFQFDVTRDILPGELNVLAAQVFPPQPDDLAISWVDWNPAPPDKNTGLWREVYLSATGPVEIRWPHVISRSDSSSFRSARLTVKTELHNASVHAVKGTLHGRIGTIQFSQLIELAPKEARVVGFSPEEYSQLKIRNPLLWWPAKLGPQNLYELRLWFEIGDQISNTKTVHFGIREITSELNENGSRVFKINGKRILIRGAGWAPDMLLRVSPKRQEAEIDYVLDMNLNTIRLEGKIEDEHFLDLCDRRGILLMAGWCCCDHWEKWANWKSEDFIVSADSLRDQIRRLRTHPSVFDWLNGSDYAPPPQVEETYVRILRELDWPNPYQSSASQAPTPVTGATGLKMTGPYEYVPPIYWSTDRTRGGAFGFNTETSPGIAVPPINSLRKFLPADHLWPIDENWDFHAGRDVPSNLNVYRQALTARYGDAKDLDDFLARSQLIAYEGERAMFEAFAEKKYTATGVIQWMLNNAWPSLIWHLYDYYLCPAGGYFGTKKACEPLHIQYSYSDRSVIIVNSYYRSFGPLIARASVFDIDMHERYANKLKVRVTEDSVTRAFPIPTIPNLTDTYFLRLSLQEGSGREVSSNLYWLSAKPDLMEWDKGDAYYTPAKSFADFSGLRSLPPVKIAVRGTYNRQGTEGLARIDVANPSAHLAFFIRLSVVDSGSGEEYLPVLWEDNYFSLLPGERRSVRARYVLKPSEGTEPVVRAEGWNVRSAGP